MKTALVLGAELDILTPKEMDARMREHEREHSRARLLELPRSQLVIAAGAWPSSGNLLLNPQPAGPQEGFQWHVRNWQCAPRAAKTTSAGVIDLYSGDSSTQVPANSDIGSAWRDSSRGNALPFGNLLGEYQWVLLPGDTIWGVVSGGASGEVYSLTLWVQEEPRPERGEATWRL